MKEIASCVLLFLVAPNAANLLMRTSQNDVILDTLHHMNKPLSVAGFLCWDIAKSVNFAMELFEKTESSIMITWPPCLDNLGISPENAHRIVFIADLACEGIAPILRDAEAMLLFKPPYRWIFLDDNWKSHGRNQEFVFSNNDTKSQCNEEHNMKICNVQELTNCKTISGKIRNLNLLVDSNVNIVTNFGAKDFWYSYLVYKIHPGGVWNYEVISKTNRQLSLASRRANLRGTPLRVCYVLTVNDSARHLEDYKDSHIDTITKVNYILTKHAIDFINATRVPSFQNSWGYEDSLGRWNGMMGELTTSRADIGGSPLFLTPDRVSVIDYIAMPTPTRSKFVFKQPKLSYMSNVFLLPFRKSVWISTAGVMVLLVIALLIAAKVERNPTSDSLRPHPSDVTLMALGAMCQQGCSFSLKGFVGRIVILVLFLSLMFLYTSYSANIVALLQSSSSRIRTLSDLLNSRLKFAVHDTIFNRHYFSTATETIRKAIYEKKVAPHGVTPRFVSLRDGVQKIREGLFAFHMEIGVGYKVVEELFYENEKCGLQEIQYLQVVEPWLAVQKNSSYKEMIKIGFRRLQESGIQFRENWKLYTKKPKCSGSNSNFVSVGIVDCVPAVKLLLYGMMTSGILLLAEIFMGWRKSKNNPDKRNSTILKDTSLVK